MDFLGIYASRLPALELNATGRRMPTVLQLQRWADQTPPGFRFAVKLTSWIVARPEAAPAFCDAARTLGARLGTVLVQLPDLGRHDQQLVDRLVGRLDPELCYAVETKGDAWQADRVEAAFGALDACRVGALDGPGSIGYLRLRSPPYDDTALAGLAAEITPTLAQGRDVYAFFRHEDEPTAPAYASRLLGLVTHARQQFPQRACGEPASGPWTDCGQAPDAPERDC